MNDWPDREKPEEEQLSSVKRIQSELTCKGSINLSDSVYLEHRARAVSQEPAVEICGCGSCKSGHKMFRNPRHSRKYIDLIIRTQACEWGKETWLRGSPGK